MGRDDQPLAFEVLHAYAAGEVDPAERAAIEAQLAECEESRSRLDQVNGMRNLLGGMTPAEPDDLRWQRMQNAVRGALEARASEALRPKPRPRQVWLPVAVAAAAIIATVALIGTDPQPTVPAREPAPQRLASGAAPLEVKLASGTKLHLAPKSEVLVKSPSLPTELELARGELDVTTARATYQGGPVVQIETPAYQASATSRDFTVAYSAKGYFIEARDGEIEVTGEAFERKTVVKKGERRTVKVEAPARPSRVTKLLQQSLEKAKKKEQPAPPPMKSSSEGETRVQLVIDEKDPIKRKWLEAARAYYEGRDMDRAIGLAKEIVNTAPDRAEARQAEVLLCEALIATKQSDAAIPACEARLVRPSTDEEKRQIHLILGTIHHRQRGDCKAAIPHYGQAMVFGGTSRMDDRARLFRAECALEVGDLELAGSDVSSMLRRRDRLSDPSPLDRLDKRLQEARGGK